ncbi:RCC1/BLIP-II [Artomyces pyxidatus]|uniref:RCC1/BLIP-II n=1 Tax=Artomyces pyxidatus TaxID=48021 RepID=A0ACB8SPJ2_9AGAM|nr:RCC1/BLIP-II [Artomyces pyxidatus]
MGEVLQPLEKLKRSYWAEEGIERGRFGAEKGAGLESLAAGGQHALFIDENGTVWACGADDEGVLGLPPTDSGDYFPRPIQSLVDEGFRAIQVAAGDTFSAAISTTGDLRAWGTFRDSTGVLGFSKDVRNQNTPSPILQLPSGPEDNEKFVSAVATQHLMLLTTHGNVYICGSGEYGELGRKVSARQQFPVPQKAFFGARARKAVAIGAGGSTSFIVDDGGDVWACGQNNSGQLGVGFASPKASSVVWTPTRVAGLSRADLDGETVVQICGGEDATAFLTSGGRVFTCGMADIGQLGLARAQLMRDGEPVRFLATPTQVIFPDPNVRIVQISSASRGTMAVSADGALYAWGEGNSFELGLGADERNAETPRVLVRRAGGSWKAEQVARGGTHTVCLLRSRLPQGQA